MSDHVIHVTRTGGPLEIDGELRDGRPFHFRAKGGYWQFAILPEEFDPETYLGAQAYTVAEGADPNRHMLDDEGYDRAWALVYTLCDMWSFEVDEDWTF